MNSLPKYLYRGDSDPHGQRMLRATFKSGLLMTNLCNGGSGREIFGNKLGVLINRHIGIGWNKTHFLSFSTEEQIALNYGSSNKEYCEVYEPDANWNFAVFTFDTTKLMRSTIKEIETGIYSAQFTPNCREFLPTFKVILIDASAHLSSISNENDIYLKKSIANAERDKEWLILPVSPFGKDGEFTAKLDTYCISKKRMYKYED
jgi:hypothetical protein